MRSLALAPFAFALMILAAAQAQELKPVDPPPDFNPATEPAVIAIAKVLPAVVNISTERIVRRTVDDPLDQFFQQFFNQPMNRRPRELQQTVQSLGSGFLIDGEGLIVTNEHVVERAEDLKIQVTFSNGTVYPARYVSGDPRSDLALIKIEAKDRSKPFPFINLNNPSPNLLGQTVLALGNPLGYNSSVSRGILSANDREISLENTTYKHLLQTDAAINPGNSGGPLIDLAGRLIGISSVKMSFTPQGTPTQGLGFAIPAKTVAGRVEEFKKDAADPTRRVVSGTPILHRLFGLELQALTPGLAETLGVRPGSGCLVSDVEDGSPASRAGFERGMIVYKMGAYAVQEPARVEQLLKGVDAGTPVDFVVGRSGARRGLSRQGQQLGTVTLVARGDQ